MVAHTLREGPRTTLQKVSTVPSRVSSHLQPTDPSVHAALKHLDYFDTNHDDVITLLDSYRGFRGM